MGQPPAYFCLFFTIKLFAAMIYKLGIELRHFCIYDESWLISVLYSAHGRDSRRLRDYHHHAGNWQHDVSWL